MSDLVADLPNYGHLDANPTQQSENLLPSGIVADGVAGTGAALALPRDLLHQHGPGSNSLVRFGAPDLSRPLREQLQEVDYGDLAQAILMQAEQRYPGISRRDLLARLSTAFAMAAVTPLVDGLNGDERAHLRQAAGSARRFDEFALRYCEDMVSSLRRQGDVLGARLTMQSVLGHQKLAGRLAAEAPSAYQSRALSTYAELTQLVGWLCFNANDYRSAQHHYEEARSLAHDAQNVELVTYVLCTMSHLATWQGKPRVGIDHAVAAQVWGQQADSAYAKAYAADVAARAFAAGHQANATQEALKREQEALVDCRLSPGSNSWWYFYDESFYWSTKTECALHLGNPELALQTADDSIALQDPSNLHNMAFHVLFRAEAYVQQGNIAEAGHAIGEAAVLAAANSSRRIDQRITDLRTSLKPWQRTKAVRALDELLVDYRQASSGSGNT